MAYKEEKLNELMNNPGIIRNRKKVEAAVKKHPHIHGDTKGIRFLFKLSVGIYRRNDHCKSG